MLQVSGNRMLREIFRTKGAKVGCECGMPCNKEICGVYKSPSIISLLGCGYNKQMQLGSSLNLYHLDLILHLQGQATQYLVP